MKYRLVEIRSQYKGFKDRAWKVSFCEIEGDRKESKAGPNALGFFYYPVSMSDTSAFAALKGRMIQAHLEEIENLRLSAEKLNQLEVAH